MKKPYCQACSFETSGVRTRKSIAHTCGSQVTHIKLYEQFVHEGQYDVYHGTSNTEFKEFKIGSDVSNPVYGTSNPDNGLGIFFTDNEDMARYFAGLSSYNPDKDKYVKTRKSGRVISAAINLNNPYIIDEDTPGYDGDNEYDSVQIYFDQIKKAGGVDRYKAGLIKKGYDGIILNGCSTNYYGDGTYSIFVVFDTKDISMNESVNCESDSNIYYNHWQRVFKMSELIHELVDKRGMFRPEQVSEWMDAYGITPDSSVAWVSSDTMPDDKRGMSSNSYNRSNDVPETDIGDVFVNGEDGKVIPEISDGANSYLFLIDNNDEGR